MKYLHRGHVKPERLKLLLAFTKMEKSVIRALTLHLCTGYPVSTAASKHGMEQSNLSRAIRALNEVAEKVEAIKEHDWPEFRSVK